MGMIEDGYTILPPAAPERCADLVSWLRGQRAFDRTLFLTEAEFDVDPQWRDVNPKPGRNVMDNDDDRPVFGILRAWPFLTEWLEDWDVLDRKIVCGLPASEIPDWVKARTRKRKVNNLGPFIRPEYRDITYFHGIDFHQDIIDHPGRDPDFLTVYTYLSDVDMWDAPLMVLPGTHKRGAEPFPHDVGGIIPHHLIGAAGSTIAWHPCLLHGTRGATSDQPRLSIRALYTGKGGKLAELNRELGIGSIQVTRHDLALDGSPRG